MDEKTLKTGDRQIVSALRKLLSDTKLEDLFTFMHRIYVPITLSCHFKSKHRRAFECRVFVQERNELGCYETVREYTSSFMEGEPGGSARHVVSDAIARFLIGEQRDFHEFERGLYAKQLQGE